MAPAGLSRGGERRTGFLLAREGDEGAYPKEPGSLLSQGSDPLDSCLRRKDTGVGAKKPGLPLTQEGHLLDWRLRGNDTCWAPAYAGMTLGAVQPASASPPPASAARGEAGRLPPKGLLYKVRAVEAVEIRLGERPLLARLRIDQP